MAKKGKLPDDIVDTWQEIFKDIKIYVFPIDYLNSFKV
jgi:hypothetical protein